MSDLPSFPGAPRIGGYSFLNPCLLLRQAGQGGMGMVYEAFDVLRDQRVALKSCTNPAFSPRFYSEAIIGVGDFGEHVVQVLDIRAFQNTDYILMEWVDGTDLSRYTRDRILTDGELVGVALQLCDGLARIHAGGIIHRDIKPANLMLTTMGVVKLADFGIAQTGEALHMPTTGPIGTQLFMSPEQREGKPVDGRSDIYSAGVTLYVMATGLLGRERSSHVRELLIRGLEPIAGVSTGMDPGLAVIIDRCIQSNPEDRYESVEALREALAPLESLAAGLMPTIADNVPELPPRDVVHQARTRMMSLNREDSDPVTIEPTLADVPTRYAEPEAQRERATPIPAVRPTASKKPVLVGALAVALVALVAGYAMTEDRPGSGDPSQAKAAIRLEPGTGEPRLGEDLRVETDPPEPLGTPKQEALERAGSAAAPSASSPQATAQSEADEVQTTQEPNGPPTGEQERADEAAQTNVEQVSPPPATEAQGDAPTPSPDGPAPHTLATIAGLDLHTDEHGRLAYVPRLERGTIAPRKLRFVRLEIPGLEDYLVQEVEVSAQVAGELGLHKLGTGDPCLPWDRVSSLRAAALTSALNLRVPADASYRFAVPSRELRRLVEQAAGDCLVEQGAANAQPATKDGDAPLTEAMNMARPKKVDEPNLWVPFGGAGLYGLVGNVAELCLVPGQENVEYRGGAAQDLTGPGASIRSGTSKPATPKLERAGFGLRLFLRL